VRFPKFTLAALIAIIATGAFASSALARPAAVPVDTEVVLPSRVANAIARTEISLGTAQMSVDTGDTVKAAAALKAVRANVARADKAARYQMNLIPADPEAETTSGPDSVIAVLTLEHDVITNLVALFDAKSGATVDALSPCLFATLNTREALVDAVIALDPEGAGAPYADGMPDIVPDFDDEVSNLQEGLAEDVLSTGGRKVVTSALAQSQRTQAKVAAAFGGGE
jgi:hypothetical protein